MITKGIRQLIAEAQERSRGDMGMQGVLHLEGGFGEWRKAGAPTAAKPAKKKA